MVKLLPRLLAVLSLALAWQPAVAQPALPPAEKPSVTISIGTWVIQYLPLPVAIARGYFKDAGMDVTLQNFDAGGSKALQSLIGGSSDLVVGYYDHTVQMQAQHKDVRCVILLNITPGIVLAVRKDLAGQIKKPSDLKGRRIGVTALGSSTEFQLDYLVGRAGLDKSDVVPVPVGSGPTAVAAVEHKSVDAILTQDPTYSVLERRNLVDPLVDARTVQGSTEAFGGRYPTACLYATGDFIKRNPGTVQRLVNGLAQALHWIHDTPADQIVHALPAQYALGDPALFAEVITASKPMFSVDGRFETADIERAKHMMSAIDPKIAAATIKLDDTYTNQFTEKVPGVKN